MGNAQQVKDLKLYTSTNVVTGSQEGTNEGTQLDLYSHAHDTHFINFVTPTAKGDQVFGGPVVEDIVEKPSSTPSKEPMNINLNVSAEPLLKQKPSEVEWSVPKISSQSISISPPFLDNGQVQKPWKSEILAAEVVDESKEDDSDGKNKVTGHLIKKETAHILPPVLECCSGRFPKKSPKRTFSKRPQLTVFPTKRSDGHHVAYQDQIGGQEMIGANQTFNAADTNTTSQCGSLAIANSTALEGEPLNCVLIPLTSSQNTKQMAKSHPLFAPISSALESIREYSSTELLINTPSIEDGEAEKVTEETAATYCTNKVNPVEDESMSISPLSPCNTQAKTRENTQVRSIMYFSYADASRKRLEVSQPKGSSKHPDKDEQGGHQNSSRVKVATAKEKFLSNRRQNSAQGNSKKHETLNGNKITQSSNLTRPPAPPFNFSKAQPRFEWTSSCNNEKDNFQLKGSWNKTKPQAFTPNDSIPFCKRNVGRNKVQHTTMSSWTVLKKNSTGMRKEEAKPKEYKSYPIARRSATKVACNLCLTNIFEEPAKSRAVVSVQPQDVGLQTPESTLPKKRPSENLSAATLKPHVQAEKSDQKSKCETPDQVPEVEPDVPQPMPQSEITEDTETSVEEHGDTSKLSNSCSSIPHKKETTESNDQIPNQSLVVLENVTTSEQATCLEVPDNEGVNNDSVPDVAPKNHPSGRWKPFYVDTTCTMKCRSRHNPGKLPPNVVRWLSALENKLPEPERITTQKEMSPFIAGTKFAKDHHSSYMLEESSTKSKMRH